MVTSKVFKVFEKEVIPEGSTYEWTESRIREQKPSWKDLKNGHIAIPQHFLSEVLECLKREHFCITVGEKETGKTWLSYIVGHYVVETEKKKVRFVTIDENFSSADAWGEIKSQELKGNHKPDIYFIVEDCHVNCEESEEFLQKVLGEGEENLRFLFTMRKVGKTLLEDIEIEDTFFNEGIKRKCIVWLRSDEMYKEYVKNIVKKFIESKKIKYNISNQELEDLANKWGNNLYWIWLRLNSWKYQESQEITEISDDQIYESIWSPNGEIKLSNKKNKDILLPISIFCQFEPLKISLDFLQKLNIEDETLNVFRSEGILYFSEWKGYDLIGISESFADIIISTLLKKDPFFTQAEYAKYTLKSFKEYLKSKLPNSSIIFLALSIARRTEKSEFAKEMFYSLFQDKEVLNAVKEKASHDFLYRVISLVIILRKINKQVANDILIYHLQHNDDIDRIVQQLIKKSISGFNEFFRAMSRIDDKTDKKVAKGLNNFVADLKNKLLNTSATQEKSFFCFLNKLNPKLVKSLLLDEELRRDFQNKLKTTTIKNICSVLKPLSKSTYLEEFFEAFSISDWEHIINSSTLNSIRSLLYGLMSNQWNLPITARTLTKALINANLNHLISEKDSSLFRLNGLIGNVKQIDLKNATEIIRRLSLLDFSELFLRKDSPSKKRGHTKVECINWFLVSSNLLYPYFISNIANKVNDQKWSSLIFDASLEDGFWLFWNIYRGDPDKAVRLAQKGIGEFLIEKCIKNQNQQLYLALLGVLHLCGFAIPTNEGDITKIKRILTIYKKEKKITLLLLSLVGLKIQLSSKQFKIIRKILDKQLINHIRKTPDLQLKQIFNNLVKNIFDN